MPRHTRSPTSIFQLSCVGGACEQSFAFSLDRKEQMKTLKLRKIKIWLFGYWVTLYNNFCCYLPPCLEKKLCLFSGVFPALHLKKKISSVRGKFSSPIDSDAPYEKQGSSLHCSLLFFLSSIPALINLLFDAPNISGGRIRLKVLRMKVISPWPVQSSSAGLGPATPALFQSVF